MVEGIRLIVALNLRYSKITKEVHITLAYLKLAQLNRQKEAIR